MIIRLVALALLPMASAFAGNSDFDRLVKGIGETYGKKPTHIPMMGLANFVVHATHPKGVSSFRLAVFEDLPAIDHAPTIHFRDCTPTIEVHENEGDSNYIFIEPAGDSARILVATIERNQATVVEAKVSPEILRRTLNHPDQIDAILGISGSKIGGDKEDDDR